MRTESRRLDEARAIHSWDNATNQRVHRHASREPEITKTLLLLCAIALCRPALAGEGDVVEPAHRTRDGHYVPANVPPLSGGTYMASRPGRSTATPHRGTPKAGTASAAPIFVEARQIPR